MMTTFSYANVLVTGAAGFIGFHLSRRLLADGCRVTGIDNLNPYYDVQLKKDRLALLTGSKDFAPLWKIRTPMSIRIWSDSSTCSSAAVTME